MSVKLRLRRMGRRKAPVYALVAADSRSPRDGRYIEDLGRYEPLGEVTRVTLNEDRVLYWLRQGAQPSETANSLLHKEGFLLRLHLERKGKSGEDVEQALAEFRARRADAAAQSATAAERRRAALEAERKGAAEAAKEAAEARRKREAELEAQRKESDDAERAAREEATAEAPADEAPAAEAAEEPVAEEAPAAEVAEAAAEEAGVAQPAAEAEVEEAAKEDGPEAEEAAVDAAAPAARESADDLTRIHGVGPKYAEALAGAGLTTFAAVAAADLDALRGAIAAGSEGSEGAANEETWAEQAALLAAGDEAGFEAYVEKLKA